MSARTAAIETESRAQTCDAWKLPGLFGLKRCDVTRGRAVDGFASGSRNDGVPPCAVDSLEARLAEPFEYSPDHRDAQRYEIGIAAHEAHPAAVRDDLHDVAAEQRPA